MQLTINENINVDEILDIAEDVSCYWRNDLNPVTSDMDNNISAVEDSDFEEVKLPWKFLIECL